MARQKPPTLPPDRALKALTQQLDGLQKLKDRQCAQAGADESKWTHFTESVIEAAFGDPSSSLDNFYRARSAGEHTMSMVGTRPQQLQANFELRIREYDALLRALIGVLRLQHAYLDEQVFNLSVAKVPAPATVRILSNKIGTNVDTVARMNAKSRSLELRSSVDVHDRMLFIDQRGWVIGQSIKDAARKKPTYLMELEEPSLSTERDIHNKIWSAATSVI